MVDLDEVAVSALITCLYDRTACGSDHEVAAFAVNVHSGMKLISPSAERIAAKPVLIIYFAKMRPHRGQVSGVRIYPDRIDLCSKFGVLTVCFVFPWAACVDGYL